MSYLDWMLELYMVHGRIYVQWTSHLIFMYILLTMRCMHLLCHEKKYPHWRKYLLGKNNDNGWTWPQLQPSPNFMHHSF